MPNFLQSVPAWFGSSTDRAANWMQGLVQPQSAPPSNLFQTRVTHTPGGIAPIDEAGLYDPNADPVKMIASRTDLTPQEKATLIQAWQSQGKGFITMAPDRAQSPSTIRHEQWHDLYQKAGLGQMASQIAPMVSPDIIWMLHNTPVYQQEMKASGVTPIEADEGTANDLFTYGRQNPQLTDYINRVLASQPQRQKQFKQLTKKD